MNSNIIHLCDFVWPKIVIYCQFNGINTSLVIIDRTRVFKKRCTGCCSIKCPAPSVGISNWFIIKKDCLTCTDFCFIWREFCLRSDTNLHKVCFSFSARTIGIRSCKWYSIWPKVIICYLRVLFCWCTWDTPGERPTPFNGLIWRFIEKLNRCSGGYRWIIGRKICNRGKTLSPVNKHCGCAQRIKPVFKLLCRGTPHLIPRPIYTSIKRITRVLTTHIARPPR